MHGSREKLKEDNVFQGSDNIQGVGKDIYVVFRWLRSEIWMVQLKLGILEREGYSLVYYYSGWIFSGN